MLASQTHRTLEYKKIEDRIPNTEGQLYSKHRELSHTEDLMPLKNKI